jgi:hypothetical protein
MPQTIQTTTENQNPAVEPPTGARVFCERCNWHGTDHQQVGEARACPNCGSVFGVTGTAGTQGGTP